MNRSEALEVVRAYPDDQLVSDLYDHDDEFASALNDLFPGSFEYPDFSHRNVREVVRMAEAKNQDRFEYYDPFADAKYSFKTIEEMISVCDDLGSTRFQVAHLDGTFTQVNKVSGKWERDDDPSVMRRQAESSALMLSAELEKRIRAEFKEDKHDVSQISPEVRMAYREMGVNPHENAEKNAMQAIDSRNMAFEDAEAVTKSALLDSSLDLNTRLQAMRELKVTVLSPEVSRMWAELDIRDFLKIQMSPHRKEAAGLLLATNSSANAEYKSTLIEKVPSVATMVAALAAENDRKIVAKEERKAAEMENSAWPDFVSTVGVFVISKNDRSGMVGLSKVGESQVVDFGGIPAIQSYAKENPEVPVRVVNELLARDGGYGYLGTQDVDGDYVLMHPDENRVIVRSSIEEVWAAAAKSAVRHSELSDLKMRCEMLADGNPVSVENPWCGDGEWSGSVVLESDNYLLVSLGDNKYVAHEKAKLDGAVIELSGDVPIGAFMHVVQEQGRFVFEKIIRNNEPEFEDAECAHSCRP